MPAPAHGPHATLRAGSPSRRLKRASASSSALAAGYSALARCPKHDTGRRVQHEELKRNVAGDVVQQPGPVGFAAQDLASLGPTLAYQRRVADDAGSMHDATQRRQGAADLVSHELHAIAVRRVRLEHPHCGAKRFQLANAAPSRLQCRAAGDR